MPFDNQPMMPRLRYGSRQHLQRSYGSRLDQERDRSCYGCCQRWFLACQYINHLGLLAFAAVPAQLAVVLPISGLLLLVWLRLHLPLLAMRQPLGWMPQLLYWQIQPEMLMWMQQEMRKLLPLAMRMLVRLRLLRVSFVLWLRLLTPRFFSFYCQ